MKIKVLSFCTLVLAAAAGLIGVDAQADVAKMLCLVNRARAQAGLRPLGYDKDLTKAAEYHSGLMAKYQSMQHQLSGEPGLFERIRMFSNISWRSVAENIAYGQSDEEDVMNRLIRPSCQYSEF
jgi:uncharacterized protein YkwD